MSYTDDPVRDAEQYEYEKEKRRQERIYDLPECDECGDRIDDDYYYECDDRTMCPSCVSKHMKWLW